uniref:Endoplasmic reticulum-Golgi intermediate compartment protein 3 n=1 Tax=Steinernema glaseri TaxID=37863 RepID=A0A1I8AA75_9BILA
MVISSLAIIPSWLWPTSVPCIGVEGPVGGSHPITGLTAICLQSSSSDSNSEGNDVLEIWKGWSPSPPQFVLISAEMGLLERIKQFDAYSKPLEDFRVRTFAGGTVTIASSILIVWLFVTETMNYLQPEVAEQLFVDSSSADVRVDINFDVQFNKLPCFFISVDVMDISSDNQNDVQDSIFRQRIDAEGRNITGDPEKQAVNQNSTSTVTSSPTEAAKCGSCYGARDGCCNTCEDVKTAYHARGWQINDIETIEQCKSDAWVSQMREHQGEGCRLYGKVQVAKVSGNFHIAPGAAHSGHRAHFHDLHSVGPQKFDTTHTIRHLSFGPHFPGKVYPLDGKTFHAETGGIMFQYYLKVVPTMYHSLTDSETELDDSKLSYQYSITTNQKDIGGGASGLPGMFIQYEFSPLMVKYEEKQQSLSHFLVSLCAIIGGVFTVASLLDSFIYTSSRAIQRKIQINKLT